jgi:hypothetical protein
MLNLVAGCSKLPSGRILPGTSKHDSAKTGGARKSFQPVKREKKQFLSLMIYNLCNWKLVISTLQKYLLSWSELARVVSGYTL